MPIINENIRDDNSQRFINRNADRPNYQLVLVRRLFVVDQETEYGSVNSTRRLLLVRFPEKISIHVQLQVNLQQITYYL